MALTDEGLITVPGMLSRWVRLGSGAKAHYMTSGESGPAVDILSFALIAGPVGDVAPHVPIDADAKKKLMAFDGSPESMRAMMAGIIYREEAVTDDLIEMRTRSANKQKASYSAIPPSFLGWVAGRSDPVTASRLTTRGRLDTCGVPGIYLYGRNDVILPVENGFGIEPYLPDVQFFYPDECGHQGQTDQPEMFNEVFLEFFRDGRVGRRTADWAGVSDHRPENPALVEAAG